MVKSSIAAPLCAAILLGLAAAGPSRAASPYDGIWSVLVVTDQGSCDRGYRYSLRIKNGRVFYNGQADFDISGQVSAGGAVHVRITRGRQGASGSGRLTSSSGFGRWSGASSETKCSGHWEAERRAAN